jgi:hypothetical protein
VLVGVARALRLRAADGSFLATHDSLAYGHYPDEATLRAGLDGCLQSLSHGERDCPRLDRGSKNAEHFSGEGLQQNSEQVEGSSHPHPKSHLMDVISTSPSGRGVTIGLFRIDGSARHVGMIARDGAYPTLIHAYAPARKVVEHRLCEDWQRKMVALYRIESPSG